MSKTIDPERIENGDLSEEEVRYLQDRGQLPSHVDAVEVTDLGGPALDEVLNTGTANTAGLTIEELESLLSQKRASERAEVKDNLRQDKKSMIDLQTESSGEEAEDEEEVEDYRDGWNNANRQAELARRGLSTEGDKETLIQRLVESDEEDG